ncbi:MAG: mevalonate kinase [Desulfurococcaceae archaeon]
MICSIAPAKVLLFGEHFVVRGKPALGLAVAVYAKACVHSGSGKIFSRQLGIVEKDSKKHALFSALINAVYERYGPLPSFDIYIDSDIPMASGMGSSASISVALTQALLTALGADFNREDIRIIAHEAEKSVHYKPSGVDTSLATYGGLLYYKQGLFRRLNLKLPENIALIIVNTGIERSTGEVVRDVLNRSERLGIIAEHIYSAGENIVEKAVKSIESEDIVLLGELMTVNHGLLWSLGASNKSCDEIVYALINLGAYGSKLSGAGRGGIVIGLISMESAKVAQRTLNEMGYKSIIATPDYIGVRNVQSEE